jgi:sulfite reductase (NADPH) flavoprotein alpha-component
MHSVLRVENSPFNQEQVDLLNRLLPGVSAEQIAWLSGYMAGMSGRPQLSDAQSSPAPAVAGPAADSGRPSAPAAITVLYGSQTGNATRLAQELSRRLGERGRKVDLCGMGDYQTKDLKKTKCLLVVASTHGNGEPPDNAVTFCEFLHGRRAPKLEGLRFSVLSLGDITYEQFCQTGRNIDHRLEELGASRLHPRTDCDVAYEEPAEGWIEGVVAALGRETDIPATVEHLAAASVVAPSAPSAPRLLSQRSRPFQAEVIENLNLNGRGSDKETRYLKLSIEGSDLSFEPGDSLGIYPHNDPRLVDSFIDTMRWSPEEPVPVGKEEHPLREALLKHCEITVLTRPLMEQAAVFSRDGLPDLLHRGPQEQLRAYIEGRDLLDLVTDFSLTHVPARDFVPLLRKLPPRLYSIASSLRANPDEVDLTIAAVRYRAHQRDRYGTCSVHCADRVRPGDTLAVYVNANPNFRMPPRPDVPMIMVGPGTGVAPFRAFLQEREEIGAAGKNWLFFGGRRFRTDFLYQREWQRWVKQGLLTRMDIAFSRDIDRKVYVQHRMLQRSRELYAWLQEGAYFYVCGDEKAMAPDVHGALETILQQEGHMGREAAQARLADWKRQGRYLRDVY